MVELTPNGRVTGIGSLPLSEAEAAVRWVAAHSPALPFWPQLPQQAAGGGMLAQTLAPLLDLVTVQSPARIEVQRGRLGEFRRRLRQGPAEFEADSAAGFFAFERAAAAGMFAGAAALKAQVTGPLTLGFCLFYEDRPLAERPDALTDLSEYVARLGAWQIARLRTFSAPVLLFVDEPVLGLDTLAAEVRAPMTELVSALRGAGAYVGVHSCAASTPDALVAAQPDILSFDAHQYLEPFLASEALRGFVELGGWLALGAVPTWRDLSSFRPAHAFLRWATTAEGWLPLPMLAAQTLVTATCGLGLLDEAAAQASFAAAEAFGAMLRQVAEQPEHQANGQVVQ